MAKGDSYGFAQSIPERRGFAPIPSDRTRKYSPISYRAQYGIPLLLAERFVKESQSHHDVQQRIHRHFAEHPGMKQAAMEEYDGPGAREVTPEERAELEKKLSRTSWSDVGRDMT